MCSVPLAAPMLQQDGVGREGGTEASEGTEVGGREHVLNVEDEQPKRKRKAYRQADDEINKARRVAYENNRSSRQIRWGHLDLVLNATFPIRRASALQTAKRKRDAVR
jgi:hypothetical protein